MLSVSNSDEPSPIDPREVLKRNRSLPGTDEELDKYLSGELEPWLRKKVWRKAKETSIDAEDLWQEVLLRVLKAQPDTVQEGFKSWLIQCIDWAVQDELRKKQKRGVQLSEGRFEALREEIERKTASEDPDRSILTPELLESAGLSPVQVHALMHECYLKDASLKDLAERIGESHANVRKARQRGLDKLARSFGLDERHVRVLTTYRHLRSLPAVAHELEMSLMDVETAFDQARKIILKALDGESGTS